MSYQQITCAPVVLFGYNRPQHLAATISALAANRLANQTHLIVYSDAPKTDAGITDVLAVRDYLKTIDGFGNITVIEREYNWGLADSIVDGVTTTVDNHGACIVLEDDIITSPFFLEYMNTALSRYQHEEQVMHVAAHMLPIKQNNLPESFFMRQSSCWGWATWKRAWRYFHRQGQEHINTFTAQDIKRFNLDDCYDYWSQLLANESRTLKTWAVYWYACVFSKKGLCLHPRQSLVQNIGFDGTGENCGHGAEQAKVLHVAAPTTYPDIFREHKKAMRRYQQYLQPQKQTNWWEKIKTCLSA